MDPSDLANYLGQHYDVTYAADDDDNYYMYVVGPDGATHEVCIPKPEIGIDSGDSENPILVDIEWHVEFI